MSDSPKTTSLCRQGFDLHYKLEESLAKLRGAASANGWSNFWVHTEEMRELHKEIYSFMCKLNRDVQQPQDQVPEHDWRYDKEYKNTTNVPRSFWVE